MMEVSEQVKQFKLNITKSIDAQTFVKISFGNYRGAEENLKQILIRKLIIKREDKLTFTLRYKTRDIVKNFSIKDGVKQIFNYLEDGFRIATLFTTENDIILEELNNKKIALREMAPSTKSLPALTHDKAKERLIKPEAKAYLQSLKITDSDGKVFKNAQDKFRQINHYIEILNALIKELPEGTIKKVADMGSGKGYLTFALYDYLHSVLNLDSEVIGVEYRKDMVDLCNDVANESSFKKLNFIEGSIQDFDAGDVNLLIALHACDTATDDAIFKGINANAALIVVAPCCHKQIRREIEQNKVKNDVSFLTKYGIFLERQAEMVTDGIRALILEYFGYKTKVFEFISDAHTPKNVLVVGIRNKEQGTRNKEEILQKIKASKAYFGIQYHHLERLLGL
ncbi:SAM-dependent methyltransferase [Pedobacter aquatilis]|uniref:class I SAM-dependent methyltransferase n=1 Tax=Pedobacter aquatilis TaxID=351343 RepID=UPI0025B4A8DD|nr:SAM-dependent methyltransferase [Pedobacter aquatilis]MDN3587039.1 SAM-dependent methyltransferase [Pedobacter aquatilis]